jgi:hypothetical protein
MNFRIHYTSLFQTLRCPSGEGMGQKQGVAIFVADDALLHLTRRQEYAERQNRTRLRPSREQEWRCGKGRKFE